MNAFNTIEELAATCSQLLQAETLLLNSIEKISKKEENYSMVIYLSIESGEKTIAIQASGTPTVRIVLPDTGTRKSAVAMREFIKAVQLQLQITREIITLEDISAQIEELKKDVQQPQISTGQPR